MKLLPKLLPKPPCLPTPPNRRPAALEDFRQVEALVGSQLGGLVVDSAWAKSYAAAVLVSAKEAMQASQLGHEAATLPWKAAAGAV